jgi:hypothetical protein
MPRKTLRKMPRKTLKKTPREQPKSLPRVRLQTTRRSKQEKLSRCLVFQHRKLTRRVSRCHEGSRLPAKSLGTNWPSSRPRRLDRQSRRQPIELEAPQQATNSPEARSMVERPPKENSVLEDSRAAWLAAAACRVLSSAAKVCNLAQQAVGRFSAEL